MKEDIIIQLSKAKEEWQKSIDESKKMNFPGVFIDFELADFLLKVFDNAIDTHIRQHGMLEDLKILKERCDETDEELKKLGF